MNFYDGKIRPLENPPGFKWTEQEHNRVCFNCGKLFAVHNGYTCPTETK